MCIRAIASLSNRIRLLVVAALVVPLIFAAGTDASAQGAFVIDGDPADWAGVPAFDVPLRSLDGARTTTAQLQVEFDDDNIYVLVSVDDDYNATLGEHRISGSLAVQWAIDPGAGPHMGTDGVNVSTSLGAVDMWHWEIDCAPGTLNGGVDRTVDGNDPACNFDDEFATTPFDRVDDAGDNFLQGAFDHSARAAGEDAAGTWYWEMTRPRTTTEAQDIQFTGAGPFLVALAYWDPDESVDGWSAAGHLQSSDDGWIAVTPGAVPARPPQLGGFTIDGDPADWAGVPAFDVPLRSLDGARTTTAQLQVEFDDDNIYVLVSVDDDYNATLGEHRISGSLAVQWAIDPGAGPHMGTDGVNVSTSLGAVDMWHWEIDCAPGTLNGGVDRTVDGNDPACNFDDEFATTPFDRVDDAGDNFLQGAFDHSARAAGEDAAGTWYWEMTRPRTTTEAQDIQFTGAGPFLVALAYWDPDESVDGWSAAGHLQSSDDGWIAVTPGAVPARVETAPTVTPNGGVCVAGLTVVVVEAPSGSVSAAVVAEAIEARCGLTVERLWSLEGGEWLLFVPGPINFGLNTLGPLSAVFAVLS